jgi:hypothetical protein
LIYAVVPIVILLLLLIRVWRGSDLGFWVITGLLVVFGVLTTIILCGWLYLLLQNIQGWF